MAVQLECTPDSTGDLNASVAVHVDVPGAILQNAYVVQTPAAAGQDTFGAIIAFDDRTDDVAGAGPWSCIVGQSQWKLAQLTDNVLICPFQADQAHEPVSSIELVG